MDNKKIPFTLRQIKDLTKKHQTPFYIYDKVGIIQNSQKLQSAFDQAGVSGFRNYFAVKACPNPYIMRLLSKNGMGFDASSQAELILAQSVLDSNPELLVRSKYEDQNFRQHTFDDGLPKIMFTSNNTPAEEYQIARKQGAIINMDDISHIQFYQKKVSNLPKLICFRLNPGQKLASGKENVIGKPQEAKFGLTNQQIIEAYKIAKDSGVKRFGLHTMVVSNENDPKVILETVKYLFSTACKIKEDLNIDMEFINLGGGIGVDYSPNGKVFDYNYLATKIKEFQIKYKLENTRIVMENGRAITGPFGYLVTKVTHLKNTYKDYIGVDANMANLMRPGMYGAYHHISVLGNKNSGPTKKYDVIGSLCENNDKFAVDRILPEVKIGDYLVIHDVGAHGHAMGFNYNGKLRSSEFLFENEQFKIIRRKQTLQDYFATLNF